MIFEVHLAGDAAGLDLKLIQELLQRERLLQVFVFPIQNDLHDEIIQRRWRQNVS